MRRLTLDEKIELKGILFKRGVPVEQLIILNMEATIFYWDMIFGKSPLHWAKYKKR